MDKSIFDLFAKRNPIENNPNLEKTILIVGLGNPGKQYVGNRHNVGFMAVDYIINQFQFKGKKVKSKSIVVEGRYKQFKLIFSKPQTYMNLSGVSISGLVKFHKIPLNQLLVIHDDIDLPFGVIRLRPSGGAGGQKGLGSIIERLGTKEFARLRIGVGRPPGRMDAAEYVLKDFIKSEKEEIPFILNTVYQSVRVFLDSGLEIAMNQFNGNAVKED
ncbi:MAG: aminoacyl-tRNA hydrolase [Anaerolineaceae bacterium]